MKEKRKRQLDILTVVLFSIERYVSFLVFGAITALLATGMVATVHGGYGMLVLLLVLLVYVVARIAWLSYLFIHSETFPSIKSIESGLLILGFLYLVVGMTGGANSIWMPLVYIAIAILTTFFGRNIGFFVVGTAILLEVGLPLAQGEFLNQIINIGTHVAFIVMFANLHWIMRRFDVGIGETKARVELKRILGRIESEARHFRSSEMTRVGKNVPENERRHNLSAYFEIHTVIQEILEMLAIPLRAHSCAVLWYDKVRSSLRVAEAYTASTVLRSNEFSSDTGILYGVISSNEAIRLRCNPQGTNRLSYYRGQEPIAAFCAHPIKNDDQLAGILVVDRTENIEFTDEEMEVIAIGAKQIQRAMANEELLRNLDKSQHEYYHLAEASKTLAKALDRADVLRISLEATHSIAPFDLGAIVMQSPGSHEYEIMACYPTGEEMVGTRFPSGQNLVDWVVSKNQPLAYGDFSDLPRRPVVFMPDEKLRDVASLLIVPMHIKAEAAGAFVMVSSRRDFFSEDLKHIFQIIANQIATNLENADIYMRLEEMATTDGLTGLYNKRFFNERMDEVISRAERHDARVALLVMDLDHFKKVNDTWGHPIGDVVLRDVAGILKESMRKTDLVARWGGEEFVVLLDSADHNQAFSKAEELRENISSLVFETETSEFSVSSSIGIAIFPDDTRQMEALVEKADAALYESKRSGRNRTTLYRSL